MKLAISNIAWQRHDDPEILSMLRQDGVQGIEVAPTKIWPNWEGASTGAAEAYRQQMMDGGFAIPALQAILFGRPDLQLFRPGSHDALIEHLKFVADLATAMGAEVLVFGAPKNRKRGQLPMGQAVNMAVDVMRRVGAICAERGVCIGWEHNPVEYGCDFVTNAGDARDLVDQIDSPGVQLHLDAGGLHLCEGEIGEVIASIGAFVHYHASEPMLAPLAGGVVDHAAALEALKKKGYTRWVSIEMKQHPAGGAVVHESIRHLLSEGNKSNC